MIIFSNILAIRLAVASHENGVKGDRLDMVLLEKYINKSTRMSIEMFTTGLSRFVKNELSKLGASTTNESYRRWRLSQILR